MTSNDKEISNLSCDVLIIGGGSAGLRAAIEADDAGSEGLISEPKHKLPFKRFNRFMIVYIIDKKRHLVLSSPRIVLQTLTLPWICGEDLYLKLKREYPFRKN